MKKKIYFTISSILQLLGNFYIFFNIKEIARIQLESVREMYSSLSPEFQERTMRMLEKSGEPMLIAFAVLGIILNIIILKEALSNNILRKKGMLIVFSCICLFTAESELVTLIALINIIVLLCLKRKNPEDFPVKEKKEMPKLEYQKSTKKEKILGIVLIVIYFAGFIMGKVIPKGLDFCTILSIDIAYYVTVFVLSIIVFKDRLKRDIKLFKENSKAYFRYVLPRYGIIYLIIIVANLICAAITKQAVSVNQKTLEAMPQWFVIPLAVIYAPLVEELIFRGVIRRFIKNEKIFIVVSAIIFGLLHTVSEASILSFVVMTIPYAILGGFLAYLYAKTDNICNNILVHFMNNAIAMFVMSVLMFGVF